MTREYPAGAALFQEGDPSDVVYLVRSGTVAVIKERGDSPVLLGRVRSGEFLGEMGVVEGLPRSATARAETAVSADIFGSNEFLELVAADSDLALNLIRRLSIRLRKVDNRVAQLLPGSEPVPAAVEAPNPAGGEAEWSGVAPVPVTIRGGSYALQMYIGTDPIKVGKMPFTVGRVPEGPAVDQDAEPDLGIVDPEPHRLSPAHFILFEDHKRIFVRDCNSDLGTVVNDRNLGRDFPIDQIALTPGENTIIAGGDGSPYKFLIEV